MLAKGMKRGEESGETNIGGLGIKVSDVTNHIGTTIRAFGIGLWVGWWWLVLQCGVCIGVAVWIKQRGG